MNHRVGEKGQVVIAKEIRERLGVGRGWGTVQRVVGDHVELYFIPPVHDRSLKASLKAHVRRQPVDPDDWAAIREQAWSAEPDEDDGMPDADPR